MLILILTINSSHKYYHTISIINSYISRTDAYRIMIVQTEALRHTLELYVYNYTDILVRTTSPTSRLDRYILTGQF